MNTKLSDKKIQVLSMAIILFISLCFAFIVQFIQEKDNQVEWYRIRTNISKTIQTLDESGASRPLKPIPEFVPAPEGYFKKALFIGDSRTVGLQDYGGLDEATFFASVGLSVFKIDDEIVSVDGQKMSLNELLSSRQYDSIYLMIGINELGYDYKSCIKKYNELVEKIREKQPDAIIYLEANLHVSKSKSDSSDIYNNKNIDRLNSNIKDIADNRTIYYLNVNEIFDDANGNLDTKYTYDNSHLLGKYYQTWVEWLGQRVIIK